MKIVDVAEFYTDQGGGVKTYINQKLKAGAKHGHEIVIVAPGKERGEEKRYGGRVIWVKGPPLPVDPRYYILWRKKAVHEILDRESPDIVEGSSPWTGGWFVANWPSDTIKTFIFHQDPVAVYPQTILGNILGTDTVNSLFGFYWRYLHKLSSNFDATIVSGHWLAEKLGRFNVNNPISVPFGIDKSFFTQQRRDFKLRARLLADLGLPEDATLLIAISRHHPEKHIGTLIDGFVKASEQRPLGLLLVGDGPFRAWVDWKAKGIKGLRVVGFTRNRDELANMLASSDYFVHGSAAETYGIVVAEAICSGLPVLTPKRGGAADLVSPAYGETYRAGDPKDLSVALLRLMGKDRTKLVKATEVAAKNQIGTMEDHFNLLFRTYRNLLEGK